ncbi:MAG TPA: type II toxin-antitoxin system VapC family toxin [Vicinamibacterales bacterium]|nr:type II toxin-antitoxin system VapC family toxin [Vicinamibacterales bacterium]
MIAYLDASALVKRYLVERGSRETIALTTESEMIATSIVSRAEVAAALAKAARIGLAKPDVARNAQRRFAGDWQDLVRVPVTEALVERADALAWEYGLRGYDAVQLASALTWQESVGEEIVVAAFDQQLWEAAKRSGLKAWPEEFPGGAGDGQRRDEEEGAS